MKNKKMMAIFFIALGMSFTLGAASGQKITAELKQQVIINKGNKETKQVISYNGTTYVPLRAFASLLREKVTYKEGLIYLGEVADTTYSYNNPAPIGTKQVTNSSYYTVGNYSVEVAITEVIRGDEALKKIEDTGAYHVPLDDDEEYLLAKIQVKMLSMDKNGTVPIDQTNFLMCSKNNTEYIVDVITRVPAPGLNSKLTVGSMTEGYVVLQVKKSDQAPKIAFYTSGGRSDTIANGAWFSLAK